MDHSTRCTCRIYNICEYVDMAVATVGWVTSIVQQADASQKEQMNFFRKK